MTRAVPPQLPRGKRGPGLGTLDGVLTGSRSWKRSRAQGAARDSGCWSSRLPSEKLILGRDADRRPPRRIDLGPVSKIFLGCGLVI